MLKFKLSSNLQTTAEELWNHAGSMAGVNRELFPLARMTVPRHFSKLHLSRAPIGRPLFKSWILILGFVPIDFDEITIVELFPEGGFREQSRMGTNRLWCHKRAIIQQESFCTITDEVEYEPIIALLGWLMLPIYRLTFSLRHFNLKRIFKPAR